MIFNQAAAAKNNHFTMSRVKNIQVVDSGSRMSLDNEDIYMFNSQVGKF